MSTTPSSTSNRTRLQLCPAHGVHQPVRLVQLSDLHLSAGRQAVYRGIHALPRVRRLIARIAEWRPDVIVISGDLSEDESAASYHRLQRLLTPLNVPVITVPGNHDDPAQLARPPWLPWWQTPLDVGAWSLLALNSRWAQHPEGLLSETELARLQELPPRRPALVFMHHHPLPVGTPWIDRFPLLNGRRLLHALHQRPPIRAVAFGHIHFAWQQGEPDTGPWPLGPMPTAERGNHHRDYVLLGCPAGSINTRPGVRHFCDDGRGAAARWFLLHGDGRWRSGILHNPVAD